VTHIELHDVDATMPSFKLLHELSNDDNPNGRQGIRQLLASTTSGHLVGDASPFAALGTFDQAQYTGVVQHTQPGLGRAHDRIVLGVLGHDLIVNDGTVQRHARFRRNLNLRGGDDIVNDRDSDMTQVILIDGSRADSANVFVGECFADGDAETECGYGQIMQFTYAEPLVNAGAIQAAP
jgi:hypothetical protein